MGTAIVERIAVIKDPTHITAHKTKPAISDSRMILKAALLALPECFIGLKVRLGTPRSKAKFGAAGSKAPGAGAAAIQDGGGKPPQLAARTATLPARVDFIEAVFMLKA